MNLLHRITIACSGIAPALIPMAAFAVTGTFGQYVASVVQSGLLDQAFVYTCIATFGAFIHYCRAWCSRETDATPWQYLKQFPGHTMLMLGLQVLAGAAAGLSGAWDLMTWPMLIFSAFTMGYTLDSMANKSCPSTEAKP